MWSFDAVAIDRPSGLHSVVTTSPSWRMGLPMAWPVWAYQTRAVPSFEAVTTRRPSGLQPAASTSCWCLRQASGIGQVRRSSSCRMVSLTSWLSGFSRAARAR